MADSSSCLASSDLPPTPQWLVEGGFIPMILGVAAMFWGITFVCEEFAVPAISAFCKRNRFSDSLTGSIFIGTGLSLPVFFVAVAGLFASNSAIGVGAVVGGNLFNHLVTIPSTIYICPNKTMKLDALVFSREMLLYFASCLLVLWAVKSDGNFSSAFTNAFSYEEWHRCLSVPLLSSVILVAAYALYCVVDSNFYLVEEWLARRNGQTAQSQKQPDQTESVKNTGGSACCGSTSTGTSAVLVDITVQKSCSLVGIPSETENSTTTYEHYPHPPPISFVNNDIENNDNQNDKDTKKISMVLLEESLQDIIKAKSMLESVFDQNDHYLHILSFPTDSSTEGGEMVLRLNQAFFVLTFPLRYMLYLTIPDVRRPGSESRAILSMTAVIFWLAVMSYILTVALTLIGNWWHISGAVMGITVAAWASNFPAHWSSMVVSTHGYGDVSCCNCLGSNIFNNLIGLGLPWLMYNISKQGKPYDSLEDDGVAISIFLMMGTIAIHYLLVWWSNWILSVWMIIPMITMYVVAIGFLCYFYSAIV